ncbi:hypothetical protein [Lyngbya confervoides]|uniref:Ribbon-helix-helix domain-containing protein n=1 Tax=Lyngbya confervoides BDU141951 TaxID=1574623 RepID=A0ABD4T917_9CYAN|nr:hypothetical protein [Lyngbya confervoides]MCM1985106.1 ribbon-helix-helix domain-containing protein [Lyngbya confervoides BDU141951]
MKTKITVTVDKDLLQDLEQYEHQSRSELVESAMRFYKRHLIDRQLQQFYSQHQESSEEETWTEIATENLEAAFADD